MKRVVVLLLALAVWSSMSGCSSGGGGTGAHTAHTAKMVQLTKTPEMEASFQKADKLFYARQMDDAKAAYEDYLKQYPYNALTAKAYFRLGEIAFSQKEEDEALADYRKARTRGVDPEWGAYAVYKEAVVYSHKEDWKKVLATLDLIPPENTDRKAAVRAGSLRVTAAKKLEDPLEEKLGYLELIDAYEGFRPNESKVGDLNWIVSEKTAKDEIRQWIGEEEANVSDAGRLKNWYDKRFDGKTSGGYLAWKIAKIYDQKGDYKNAAAWAMRYTQSYPKGEYMSAATALLAEIGKRGGVEIAAVPSEGRGTVGVLLPLTGKYAVYGESVLHGIECGAGVFSPCRGDLGVNLIVRDTQGDPHVAEKIVLEFSKNKDVRAVIGPLPQVEVDQAGAAAEAAALPMLSLSQKADVAKIGPYVFRNFLTVSDQVASLVDYACGSKKWKKLAILYPSGPTGEEYKKAFEQEVSRCGGKLVAQASYSPEAKNLTDAVRNLRSSSGDAGAPSEGPVKVGFDALFVPDVYRRIPEVVAALQFLGIEGVHLLGGAGWDHPGLLQGGGEKLEGSIFVDGFYAKSSNFATRDFVSTFQAAYGVDPTLLEAYAFDSMRLLGEVLRDNPSATREDLQKVLSKKKGFSGVTGNISFDEDGDARRRLTVLTVDQGEIREVR